MTNKPSILKILKEDKNYPYFFQNENIDKNIYIVQRAFNIPNALYILGVWNKEKYNVGQIDRYETADISFTKYLYHNNDRIDKIKINEGNDNYKIIIYKKEGKLYINALLKYK